jgi:acid phosphatase type 7
MSRACDRARRGGRWSHATRALALAALVTLVATSPGRPATAATLTRGPYLQSGTPASVVVRWRTLEATDTQVRWGTAPGVLTSTTSDATPVTEHEMLVSGLAPGTRYWYSVGTSAEQWGDATWTFVTPPAAGARVPVRAWILGDSGEPGLVQVAVRDAFLGWTGTRGADLMLMLGDNAYTDGTDQEYQVGLFDPYALPLRQRVLWPTRGNHDKLHSGAYNDYVELFTLPTAAQAGGVPSGTEAYYSFDHANIHFVCLDSEDSSVEPGSAQLTWLKADLAATPQDWIITFWHHPPYSKGSHDSDSELKLRNMRQFVVPLLDSLGVDLNLTGHSHSYERSFLLRRHYDRSSTLADSMKVDAGDGRRDGDGAYEKPRVPHAPFAGAVYTVAGSSSKTSGGKLDHPVMVTSQNVAGSLVLDVEGGVLDARFLNSAGAVTDSFTIVKLDVLAVEPGVERPGLSLVGVSPQPSRGWVELSCRLPRAGLARIGFYDAEGRRVASPAPVDRPAGEWRVRWDGRDSSGRRLPAGMYFALVEFDGERRVTRIVLTR